MIKLAIDQLETNMQQNKYTELEQEKKTVSSMEASSAFLLSTKDDDTNIADTLRDMFYTNINNFDHQQPTGNNTNNNKNVNYYDINASLDDNDDDDYNHGFKGLPSDTNKQSPISMAEKHEILKLVNPRLLEYVEKNKYEKLITLNRKRCEREIEKKKEKEPKCIANVGLIRLFNAYHGEVVYEKIHNLIEKGLIETVASNDDDLPSIHPIINYPLHRYFNRDDYEYYLAKMLLPSVFKFQEKCNNKPMYALVSYAACVTKRDTFVKFNGNQMTYKSILYNLLNAYHLDGNKTLKELFYIKPSFEVNNENDAEFNERIIKFLNKVWVASKNATFAIALSVAANQRVNITRFDSTGLLYKCSITGEYFPKMESTETLYYDNKTGGWIYRLNNEGENSNNKRAYYAADIITVFKEKIKTIL